MAHNFPKELTPALLADAIAEKLSEDFSHSDPSARIEIRDMVLETIQSKMGKHQTVFYQP